MGRVAAAGVAAVVLAGGLATVPATTANAAGTVYKACADKKTGALRLILKGKKCKPGEKKLSWNVKGPTGIAGPIGPQGPQGPTGARGPAGAFEAVSQDGTVTGTFVGYYPVAPAGASLVAVRMSTGAVLYYNNIATDPNPTPLAVPVLYYREAGCIGDPYGIYPGDLPFDSGIILASTPTAGSPVFRLTPGTPQAFTSQSRRTPTGCEALASTSIASAYQAVGAGLVPVVTKPLYLRPLA